MGHRKTSLSGIVPLLFFIVSCNSHNNSYTSWKVYGGNDENNHYSSLTQVDTNNVQQLKVAWEYHTGDADTTNHSQIQCNPVIIDGTLYGTSPMMKLFAIDAATGKQKWVFNPFDSFEQLPWCCLLE
jgi:quinoprotein glucose dehydrogenase